MKTIFLSRCSKEFNEESNKIYTFFKELPQYEVISQDAYIQIHESKRTLEALYTLIESHDIFVQLIGNESGAAVNDDTRNKFFKDTGCCLQMSQTEISELKKKDIRRLIEESGVPVSQITYTQWEAYIAIHLNKPILCYDLRDNEQVQKTHVDLLKKAGRYPHKGSRDVLKLCAKMLNGLDLIPFKGNKLNDSKTIELNDPCLPACLDVMGAIDFVGRINDLSSLDIYLKDSGKNKKRIIQVVAQGGTGKTKLVARWIHSRRLAASEEKIPSHISLSPDLLKSFRSGSVLGYSLYAQGTNKLQGSERAAVETPIWDSAYKKWFTSKKDPINYKKLVKNEFEPSEDKAKLLAKILKTRKTPTLLILDGLEAALIQIEGDDGSPEWITHDVFLSHFLKHLLKGKSSLCTLILTTRVSITDFEYEEQVVTHKLAPLDFVERTTQDSYTYTEDEKRKNEAASVIYYYYKGRKPEAARILTNVSKKTITELEDKHNEILREELLRSVDSNIPEDDSVLVDNLLDIASKLKGHALSLKLAGQLVAKGIPKYQWEYLAQNFDPVRHHSELPRLADDDDFSSTIRKVNSLLDPHIKIFQENEKQHHMLNALFTVGVFDRQASFEEIEYAARYLTDLEGCPLKSSNSDELRHALNELSVDGFLVPPENEDGQDEWDCHPLVRAHLSNYIFEKDEQKANICHHNVAHFYIDQLDDASKKNILKSLKKISEVDQEDYMTDIGGHKATDDERKDRKKQWYDMNKQQAIKDMLSLQRAVYHFILAGELRNAWHLYWEWMSVQKEYVFSRFFGKFHDDLVTLSYFFESPWSSIKETKDDKQKLSPTDIASLFDAAGFRLRSLSRLTEAHQASGGSFLEWHKAGWSSYETLSEEKKKKTLRESSYAAGNRAEYSMVQASLSDALMYADLAVRLADESDDPKARFIHRVELSEILWQRGDTEQAIELLEWVNCKNNIHFSEEDDIRWAELYCLYRYRYGKILVSRGDLEEAKYMANILEKDSRDEKWLLNIGLCHLLNGYIKLAEAKPSWIIAPPTARSPTNIFKNLNKGKEDFENAQKDFEKIRAGHHELKTRLGVILCKHGSGKTNFPSTREKLSGKSGISKLAGERHLFRIDAEVAKAIVYKYAPTTSDASDEDIKYQVDRARSLCITSGYLRHLPLLDSLSPKEG